MSARCSGLNSFHGWLLTCGSLIEIFLLLGVLTLLAVRTRGRYDGGRSRSCCMWCTWILRIRIICWWRCSSRLRLGILIRSTIRIPILRVSQINLLHLGLEIGGIVEHHIAWKALTACHRLLEYPFLHHFPTRAPRMRHQDWYGLFDLRAPCTEALGCQKTTWFTVWFGKSGSGRKGISFGVGIFITPTRGSMPSTQPRPSHRYNTRQQPHLISTSFRRASTKFYSVILVKKCTNCPSQYLAIWRHWW